MECKTRGGATQGFKCEICGAESKKHDPGHACGGVHCMSKCAECNEAESNCVCV